MTTLKCFRNYVIFSFLVLALAAMCTNVFAATLTWDRNAEDDMASYNVYGCFIIKCTVLPIPSMLLATVPQPVLGSIPSFDLTLGGKSGALAVNAKDTSDNVSGLSNSLFFDVVPPSPPKNLGVK